MEVRKFGIGAAAASAAIVIGAVAKVVSDQRKKKNVDNEFERLHNQAEEEIKKNGAVSEETQRQIKNLQSKL